MKLIIERLTSTAKLPVRAHPTDAGLDLFADESVILPPKSKVNIRTGVKIALPENSVGLIWDKGGQANRGLHTMAGVIDQGYRGEVIVIQFNTTDQNITLEAGQKIAQLLIQPTLFPEIIEQAVSDETSRGEGKFGSTGLK